MAFIKELFNETASLTLNVRDLLNSQKRESFTTTQFFERESEFQWRQRSVTLSFTYRFNQQKRDQQRRERGEGMNDEDMDNGGEF